MKVKVDFSEFKEAIKRLDKVKNKTDVKILDDIYVISGYDHIELTKSNLTSTLKTTSTAYVEEHGQIIIPASTIKLINNIKKCDRNEFEITDEYIKVGKKQIKFISIPVDNFPNVSFKANIKQFEVSEKELYRLLEVNYATAKDEIRPILTGINIKNNKFVAIDGYRLSVRESNEFTSDINVTIDKDMINLLLGTIDKKSNNKVKVYIDEEIKKNYDNKEVEENANIRFEFNSFEIESRLLNGEYIRYEQIIPDSNGKTKVTVKDIDALDKIQLINKLDSCEKIIQFNITDDSINFKSKDNENILEDEFKGEIEGEPLEIAFNNKYLTEGLKFYSDGNFRMYFSSKVSPMILTNDYMNLEMILPIRMPA